MSNIYTCEFPVPIFCLTIWLCIRMDFLFKSLLLVDLLKVHPGQIDPALAAPDVHRTCGDCTLLMCSPSAVTWVLHMLMSIIYSQ